MLGGGEVVEVAGCTFRPDAEDDLDSLGQVGHLPDEPGVDGDEERVDHDLHRPLGDGGVEHGGSAQEDHDPGGAAVDRPLQRHVVDDPAVDVLFAVDLDRGEDGRHRRRGQDGLDRGSIGEPPFATVGKRRGHHLDGNDGVL